MQLTLLMTLTLY